MVTDFTQGSVGKKLLLFSMPLMLGMLLQTAYNIVDAIYVGMLGPEELAAVSLTFPVVFVFVAVAGGLGIGANALMAQALGRKHLPAANNLAEHSLILGGLMGVVIAALGILFSPPLFAFMGADEILMPLTLEYSRPIFIGFIFMFSWFVSDAILRSQGNSKTPMKNLAVSVVLNIILSPILIFGLLGVPALGLTGAALATVFSRVLAAALNFLYIYTPKSVITLDLKAFKPRLSYIKQILFIGLPASASQGLTAIGFMLLTSLVGIYGSHALAAFGVGMRINSMVMLPVIGLTMGVISFVGQNVGARDFHRARRVTSIAVRIAFAIAILLVGLIILLREPIMRVFTQDASVIAIGVTYLSIVPLAYLSFGLYHVLFGAFQGAGKTGLAFAANLAYWAMAVALAFFLSQGQGLEGVWWGMALAAWIEFFLVAGLYKSGLWLKNIKPFH